MKVFYVFVYTAIGMLVLLIFLGSGCQDESSAQADVDLRYVEGASAAGYSAPASATDWPQWLGPARDGKSPESGLNLEWSQHPPQVVWRRPLGTGFSSISIANGLAYTMFAEDGDEFITAIDALTGEERWRYKSGKSFVDRAGGDGPRSTPAVAQDRVFSLGANGGLYANDASTGELLWSRNFVQEFGGEIPTWGYSGSVLVDGEKLLVETGGKKNNSLAALHVSTGETIWQSQSDIAGYSSPVIIPVSGARQAIFFSGKNIFSLSPLDGSLNWRESWITDYDINAATPVFIAPNRLFISSEYDVGSALYQISSDGKSVTQLWKNRLMKNKMATSVYHNGYLYGIDSKILKCLDAKTGEEVWKTRGFGEGTLIFAQEHLIVLSDKGVLAVVQASPDGFVEKSRVRVLNGNRCWTSPSLANGLLYLRDLKEVVCLDLRVNS